jgi:trk system potassium uptake protein
MNALIIGCGRTGAGLARALGLQGHAVTVVDHDERAFERLGPAFSGRTICGVGFDREVLLEAGITRADGVAAVTGNDEVNAVTGRLAREIFHVPRVIARLYDPRKAEIYRRLGLQTVAPVSWGVSRMVEALSLSDLTVTASLGSGEVDLVETEIPPTLAGRTVRDLTVPGEIQVAAVSRGGKTFLPSSGTIFESGDLVHLVTLAASAGRLEALLGRRS